MCTVRRLTSKLLRIVIRHSCDESQDWANAMLRELDFIESDWAFALGTWKYDGHLQTLPATWIESLVRKTLCPTGGAEEHRKTGSGSGIRRAHCGRHLGRLRFRPGTPVVISLSHVGRRASAMGPMAGRDRDTANEFHRGGARAVAEEKSMAAGIVLSAIVLFTHFIVHVATHG
jgi:hypothetical protein